MFETFETEQIIAGAGAMRAFGERIASTLTPGSVLLLHGDLGAGKTTLTQGIARGFGIHRAVTSPTFTLVSEYPVEPPVNGVSRLVHLDLYRLTDLDEIDSFGFDEIVAASDSVTIVEWPERAAGRLPVGAVILEIELAGADARRVQIRAIPAEQ